MKKKKREPEVYPGTIKKVEEADTVFKDKNMATSVITKVGIVV